MIVYWCMFAYPAILAFALGERQQNAVATRVGLAVLLVAYVVLIGFRFDTGADWEVYRFYAEDLYFVSFWNIFAGFEQYNNPGLEPGYNVVAWISAQLGWEVYGATVVCALILVYGVIRFAQHQREPWLTITAAAPYLIIVVGMSYIRQSAAIGFILLALIHFQAGNRARFVIYSLLATLFHVSSVVVFFLASLVLIRSTPVLAVPLFLCAIPAMILLMRGGIDRLMLFYVNMNYGSSGALIRLSMNLIPSIIFLLNRNKFTFNAESRLLWTLFAASSIFGIAIFMVSPSSTLIDRLAIYLIPIQLYVFGNLPYVLSKDPTGGRIISAASILYFALILFIWINYAENASAWLPYKSALL